ncbi:50S ribosomal protein L35ae [Methanopyrus sp.]
MGEVKRGVIVNYRMGRHTQDPRQCIIEFEGIEDRSEAAQLIGKEVVWKHPKTGKVIRGKVVDTHGNNGAVRVRFERGLPGQALGTEVELK